MAVKWADPLVRWGDPRYTWGGVPDTGGSSSGVIEGFVTTVHNIVARARTTYQIEGMVVPHFMIEGKVRRA